MKNDSEIGEVLAAGHPCYFVGFTPDPMPGQTIEDVCRAEARFIEEVVARHPKAQGRPVVIGNCQAGWQVMMTAAIRPDLTGPILLAGSPLSYWAGIRGQSPMRYVGGLVGGTWLTSLAGDLGAGIFDGASLVTNFEVMHPENTYWKKLYDVFAKVDSEAPRFLEFEKWWGSPVLLNADEMQYITDNLFVGNRLSTGQLRTSEGLRIDLRNIRSPILVFCSWGDDITPPPQALGWILDLYEDEHEIVSNGQTIVYSLHPNVGHLGVFVSGKVATKQYQEFVQCMDLVDLLPPGLYEAVITEADVGADAAHLINGRYLLSLERRSLDDVRAIVQPSATDDRRFETVARLSEVTQGLYAGFARPLVRAGATPQTAEALRQLHPNRLRFTLFSDRNPFMAAVAPLAEAVRQNRVKAEADNPLGFLERQASDWIQLCLRSWGEARDTLTEQVFHAVYGSPALQALTGLAADNATPRRRVERDVAREAASTAARAAAEGAMEDGDVLDAFVRAVMYVARPAGRVDERGFAALQEIGAMLPPERRPGFVRFKEIVRKQSLVLDLDEDRAIDALPRLAANEEDRRRVLDGLDHLLSLRPALTAEQAERLGRVKALLQAASPKRAVRERALAER
jgi:pimeloyl-ACP methyl ester carboxylesterase